MLGVVIFLSSIIIFVGALLFLIMTSIKTEQRFILHLKSQYPAVYSDNPYALGGEQDGRVIRKRVLWSVLFTRAKTDEAKAEYSVATRDTLVKTLKVRAWLLMTGALLLPFIGFAFFLCVLNVAPN